MKMKKWKTVRLGDVAPVSACTSDIPSEKIWLLNLDAVEPVSGSVLYYNHVAKSEIGSSSARFDTENVLYSKLRPYLNKVVVPALPGYATSELLPLKPNRRLLQREYLALFLRSPSFVSHISDKVAGAKMPRVVTKDLKESLIPLPPLDEQKRIADILDKAAELISLRKRQLEKLDLLLKSKFIDMFGDPVTNPKGWMTTTLGVVGNFKNGINYAQKDRGQTILCIGVGDFKGMGILTECSKIPTVNLSEFPDSCMLLKYGDIIFVRSNGSRNLVGRSILFHVSEMRDVTFSGFCIRLRLTISNLNAMFVYAALNSELYRNRMMSGGRGCNIKNLNQQMLSAMPVIVPPLKLQNEFSAFVEHVEKQKAQMKSGLEKLELNYKALMAECF